MRRDHWISAAAQQRVKRGDQESRLDVQRQGGRLDHLDDGPAFIRTLDLLKARPDGLRPLQPPLSGQASGTEARA
jgi:hypothetical protein